MLHAANSKLSSNFFGMYSKKWMLSSICFIACTGFWMPTDISMLIFLFLTISGRKSNLSFFLFSLQPLDVILSQDHNQIVALLEYVRYDFLPQIQQCSIKIMSILRLPLLDYFYLLSFWFSGIWFIFYWYLVWSSRMVGLVQLLLKSNAANLLVEDYAACLELRSQECQVLENSGDDSGILIMQVNLSLLCVCVCFFFLFFK